MRILITAGGTEEPIDGVRRISNTSTGATGMLLARSFFEKGADIMLLHAQRIPPPDIGCRSETFLSCADLEAALRRHLGSSDWDVVVHLAAVGDYSVASVEVEGRVIPAPLQGKITSGPEVLLRLKPNPKLVDSLRDWSRNPEMRIIAFKLTKESDSDSRREAVDRLMRRARPDLIVHNDLSEISEERHTASLFDANSLLARTDTKEELAHRLWEWIGGQMQERVCDPPHSSRQKLESTNMKIEVLKSKIHRATVTGAELEYTGSISIDPALCEAVGLHPWEKVDVLDIDNGARLSTYVILGGEGEICLNGAAARLVRRGDRVIIVSYGSIDESEVGDHRPRQVLVDEQNRIVREL